MSTNAPVPPSAPKAPPGPLAPPDEQFWQRYSPHYEFPLSSVGSFAIHLLALLAFVGLLYLISISLAERNPVPTRMVRVVDGDDGTGDGREGIGGGDPKEDVRPIDDPQVQPTVPDAQIEDNTREIRDILPQLPEGMRPRDIPAARRWASLSEDIRDKLARGVLGKKGKGDGPGTASGNSGDGKNKQGNASDSARRGARWELIFKTTSGKDYLEQLAAMKATLVFPQPSDWKSLKVYRDIAAGNRDGEPFNAEEMPKLFFVDDEADSAGKLADAMGLNFSPPYFIAFFPKDIENELAEKERAYRNRREEEIALTKFKILIRDGKMVPTVVHQDPIRR